MDGLLADILAFVFALDDRAVAFVLDIRHPFLTKMLTSVTGLGSATAALAFLGVCYLADWREEFTRGLFALSLTGVVVATLMATVQRPFPPDPVCLTDGAETVAHSFPSGHAAAVAVYATLAYDSDVLPFGVLAPFALVVAFSRIYLGTHYLSDTVFGLGVGVAAVLLATWLLDRFELRDRLPSP